jgi:hypothetical protein
MIHCAIFLSPGGQGGRGICHTGEEGLSAGKKPGDYKEE